MTKTKAKSPRKIANVTTWFIYVTIFFEMFYMATPFAIFFYSVYGVPLKWLNSNPVTSILVQPILPHFSQSNSLLIKTMLVLSWPLMVIGILVFFIGFFQIYWAKFKKQGAVLGGIYKYIRHPQYVAWSIFGLGMTIIWSRMIVFILFVTMLFVYYVLAKIEEKECLEKYGESYTNYIRNTGRFFPKLRGEKKISVSLLSGLTRKRKILLAILIYLCSLFFTVLIGLALRSHSISTLSTYSTDNYVVLSSATLNREEIKREVDIALTDSNFKDMVKKFFNISKDKILIYLLPSSWSISELGIEQSNLYESHGYEEISSNLLMHGNSLEETNFKMLIFSYVYADDSAKGLDILRSTRKQEPNLVVYIDTKLSKVQKIDLIEEKGRYKDIPVPLY